MALCQMAPLSSQALTPPAVQAADCSEQSLCAELPSASEEKNVIQRIAFPFPGSSPQPVSGWVAGEGTKAPPPSSI